MKICLSLSLGTIEAVLVKTNVLIIVMDCGACVTKRWRWGYIFVKNKKSGVRNYFLLEYFHLPPILWLGRAYTFYGTGFGV